MFSRQRLFKTIKCWRVCIHHSHQSTCSNICLTDCDQLHGYTKQPAWSNKFCILDANWDLDNKDYRQIHLNERLCCSKFFSFEECRDLNSNIPRMLPPVNVFEDYVSELGIGNEHHVIVYDNHERFGMYSAPRVWWMFRVFGHNKVTVLNGGLKQWILDGLPTVSGEYGFQEILPKPKKKFKAQFMSSLVRNFEFMEKNANKLKTGTQVVDARENERFLQKQIPYSISTPFSKLLDEDLKMMKSEVNLREYFHKTGVDLNEEIISSCGSGVTAAIVALGIYHATAGKSVSVYDGSMSEWQERASSDMIACSKHVTDGE